MKVTPMAIDLAAAAELEVEELHAAFTVWFRPGAPEAVFARFEAALAAGFSMVSPAGLLLAREPLLAGLRAAGGSRGDTFRIAIEDQTPLHIAPPLILFHYVERQWTASLGAACESARRATALLRADPHGPNGLRWLAVHETWITSPEPAH